MRRFCQIIIICIMGLLVMACGVEEPEVPIKKPIPVFSQSDLEMYLPYTVGQTVLFTPRTEIPTAGVYAKDTLSFVVTSVVEDSTDYRILRSVTLVCDFVPRFHYCGKIGRAYEEIEIRLESLSGSGRINALLSIYNPAIEMPYRDSQNFLKSVTVDRSGNLPSMIRVELEVTSAATCTIVKNQGLTMFECRFFGPYLLMD